MKQKNPEEIKVAALKRTSPGKFKTAKVVGQDTIVLDPADVGLSTLKKAFGTADEDLQTHLLGQLAQSFSEVIVSDGNAHEIDQNRASKAMNISISILSGIQPCDEIELMLVTQMVAVHNLAMKNLAAGVQVNDPERKKIVMNQATKMLRTFTAQMEALKRYRTGGQQKVTVEHVNVNKRGSGYCWERDPGGEGGGS